MKKIIGIILCAIFILLCIIIGAIFYLYAFKEEHYDKGFDLIAENKITNNIIEWLMS